MKLTNRRPRSRNAEWELSLIAMVEAIIIGLLLTNAHNALVDLIDKLSK